MKTFPRYRHAKTGLEFYIIGATETSTSKRCFVCRESPQGRERLFEIDGFDVPFVEREALYLDLLQKEPARIKAREKLARTNVGNVASTQISSDAPVEDEDDYSAHLTDFSVSGQSDFGDDGDEATDDPDLSAADGESSEEILESEESEV